LAQIEESINSPGGVIGHRTGFEELDNSLKGMQSSKLMILAARPSMGKTAMALNLAQGVADSQKKPVLFFSLEMPPEEIAMREIYGDSESQVDIEKMKRIVEHIKKTRSHLHLIDRPTLNIGQLKALMLKHAQASKGLGLVVIDYLQLMTPDGKGKNNRNEDVSAISRALKNLAREFEVPVLALSQLSRRVEERQIKKPMLSDLRDSGAIEQDADVVAFLYRDDYYNPSSDCPGVTEFIIAKQRGGRLGTVPFNFRADITRFYEPKKGYFG